MSAFEPYRGAYETMGRRYDWRCYATARVYQMRLAGHPQPPPPSGKKWLTAPSRPAVEPLHWLVDVDVDEFTQILCAVEMSGPVEEATDGATLRPARPRLPDGEFAYD